MTLESAMAELTQRRKKAIDLNLRRRISDAELDELLGQIIRDQKGVEERLRELRATRWGAKPGVAFLKRFTSLE